MESLQNLPKPMESVKKGNLDTRLVISGTDEVDQLAADFNDMVKQIKELLENLKEVSKSEKEAIYKALENQINPHFLCNALDMVRVTAEKEKQPEISNIVRRLMNTFVYNISRKEKFVTLKEELKNASDFVELHNLRNTLVMNFSMLIVILGTAMVFAILLNELRSRVISRVVQTVSFFPFFISWVIVYSIASALFSVTSGAVNETLIQWGILKDGMDILGNPDYSWGLAVFVNLWKTLGYMQGNHNNIYSRIVSPQSLKMAITIITIIPITFVFPFLQKHFAKGLLIGSVKG